MTWSSFKALQNTCTEFYVIFCIYSNFLEYGLPYFKILFFYHLYGLATKVYSTNFNFNQYRSFVWLLDFYTIA